MSSAHQPSTPTADWWTMLGFRLVDDRRDRPTEPLLRAHPPIGFLSEDSTPDTLLDIHQLLHRIDSASRADELELQRARAARRSSDLAEFEAAGDRADAHELVEKGRWMGFTRGEAAAWCWNLFQYEPRGFVHPGSEVRARALAELRAGGLPQVFSYPERARELADRGLTPLAYRRHREALGASMFDERDVRRH